MIDKIKIGYTNYAIVEETSEDLEGQFVHQDKQIKIASLQDPVNKLNTVLHEILHGIWLHWGLSNSVKGKNSEETVVNAVANGLTTVIVDNPLLLLTLNGLANENLDNNNKYT
jgi:hypothetical protein